MYNTKKLLLNQDLSPEKFDKLLEYLYWERKQELELERLKIERGCYDNIPSGKASRSRGHNAAAASAAEPVYEDDDEESERVSSPKHKPSSHSTEDKEFNAATGYGLLGESFVGKLAKTKLWASSKSKAESLFNEHKLILKEKFKPKERFHKVRTLLHYILWGSAIAQRADRWPHAKDITYLLPAKDDIDLKLITYNDQEIAAAVEFLQERWAAICPFPDLSINTTLIASRLDKAQEQLILAEKHREEYNVLKSPLVAKVLESYPYVDFEKVKARIEANRYDYRAALKFQIMQDFKVNPPPFITPETNCTWLQQVPSHLSPYKQNLEKLVDKLWWELREDQEAWDKQRKANT